MTEVICEAGVAHLGSVDAAKRLADVAKECGGKIVKYQTYRPDLLLREPDPLLESLALSYEHTKQVARHCEEIGVEFLSTPGDTESLKFLVEECGVKRIKIGSDDLTYKPLLEAAYATELPVILSTGMATMTEIEAALPPNSKGTVLQRLCNQYPLTLLHCVSEYPCPIERVNLRAMDTLGIFDYPVGYSDHTNNVGACMVAASKGAVIIEKHFCLENYDGVDVEVSARPFELKSLILGVEAIEKMLGDGNKAPTITELLNRPKLRKGPDGKRGFTIQ